MLAIKKNWAEKYATFDGGFHGQKNQVALLDFPD